MNINRENYEEFFVLYGDNELSELDRREVEFFVLQHPDLAGELAIFGQLRLSPDESIGFEDKFKLMHPETSHALKTQELLLLEVDGELPASEAPELQHLLASNPAMQAELELLMKTRFDPNERIVFPHKASLYRKEETVRVIPIFWKRIAAVAAVLIAVTITSVVVYRQNNDSSDGGAIAGIGKNGQGTANQQLTGRSGQAADNGREINAQQPSTNSSNTTDATAADAATDPKATTAPAVTTAPDAAQTGLAKDDHQQPKPSTSPLKQPREIRDQNIVPAPGQPTNDQIARKTNNLPKPTNNPNVVDNNKTAQSLAANTDKNANALTAPKQLNKQTAVTPDTDPALHLASNTSINEDDVDAGQSSKKGKFRGFFRKVTRTFEKNTNIKTTDDDRLLLGALAIKL